MAAPVPSAYYAPPPNQTPNIFAAFWSGFMQTRNPWATELFFQRLAENPEAERDALLLEHLKLRLQQGEENGRNERAMRTSEDKRLGEAVKVYQADKSYQGAVVAAEARVVGAQIGLDEARLERQNLSTESAQNAMNSALDGVKNGMAALEKATTPEERRTAYGVLERAGKDLSGNLNDPNDRAIASKQISQVINASGGRIQAEDIQTALESIGVGFGGDLGEPKPEFRPQDRGLRTVAPPAEETSQLARDVLSRGFSGQIAAGGAAATPSSARAAESEGAVTPAPAGTPGAAPTGAPAAAATGLVPSVVSRTISGPASVLGAGQGNVSRLDALADQINARPPRRRLGELGAPVQRDPTFSDAPGIPEPRTAEEAADLIAALREMAEGRTAEEAAQKVAEERALTGRTVEGAGTEGLARERERLTASPGLVAGGSADVGGRPEAKTTAVAAVEELQKEDLAPEEREFLESIVAGAGGSIAQRRGRAAPQELTVDSALDELSIEDLDPERRKVLEDFVDRENALVVFGGGTSLKSMFGEDLAGVKETTPKEGRKLLAEDAAEELVGNGMDDDEDEENKKERRGRGEKVRK